MEPSKYRLIYEGITPEQACLLPDHGQICYELASDIMAETGRQIFIGTDPAEAHRRYGQRLKTACLLLNPKQARIVKVKENIKNRTIFHELSHLRLRWIDRIPAAEAAHSDQFGVASLNNELDHLQFVRQEIEIFGDNAEKYWVREWSNFPRAKGKLSRARVFRSLAIRWLVTREVLNPKFHKPVRSRLHRFGLFDDADKFVDKIQELAPDRRAMVRFALRELGFVGTDAFFTTRDPVAGTENYEPIQ